MPDAGDRVFDESTILARVAGSHQLLAELIEAFLGECPGLMTEVREAVDLREAVRLAQAAHALKGAICNLTDKAAFRATVELETLARDGDLIHADRAFQKLEFEMRRLTGALVTYTKPGGDKAFAATNLKRDFLRQKGLDFLLGRYFSPGDCSSRPCPVDEQ